jgi:hypothetical protein
MDDGVDLTRAGGRGGGTEGRRETIRTTIDRERGNLKKRQRRRRRRGALNIPPRRTAPCSTLVVGPEEVFLLRNIRQIVPRITRALIFLLAHERHAKSNAEGRGETFLLARNGREKIRERR